MLVDLGTGKADARQIRTGERCRVTGDWKRNKSMPTTFLRGCGLRATS